MKNDELQVSHNNGKHEIHAYSWQGPIPPPNVLMDLNRVDPSFADRVLRLTEDEAAHRRQLEFAEHEERLSERKEYHMTFRRGQVAALVALFIVVAGAVAFAALGKTWLSGLFAASSIVSILGLFIPAHAPDTRTERQLQGQFDTPGEGEEKGRKG